MTLGEKINTIRHIIRWRLNWAKKDLNYFPNLPVSLKFITARQAAKLVPDGATCMSSGIGGNARCSVFFWAIRERFQLEGHPRQLCWINLAAQGGRGKAPGTIEELGLPGLMKCYISGHQETTRAQLKLAAAGQLELHTLPQGVMSFLLEDMGNPLPKNYYRTKVGLHTFLDPRTGTGSAITEKASHNFVKAAGDLLQYNLPNINLAFFCAPYADTEGNIYFHHAATISENRHSARAAKAHGGKAIVTVSAIIPKDEKRIRMYAHEIDHIVVHPHNEQVASVRQHHGWSMFNPGSSDNPLVGMKKLKFINHLLKITPVRNEVDHLLGRLGALVFAMHTDKNVMVNIGVGFPEVVATQLMQQGLHRNILFTTESGSYGGIPGPGIFFGASINPLHLESSTEMFNRYRHELDVAILGFLQIDSQGNVNASKRGDHITAYVGPGGFPDIASGAKMVLFVGNWMSGGIFKIKNKQLQLKKRGHCKFVDQVKQVTFNGAEELKSGKKIFYITNVGVFTLTAAGLMLIMLMPGIDLKKDILEFSGARIILPPDNAVTVVDASIFDLSAFNLFAKWEQVQLKTK